MKKDILLCLINWKLFKILKKSQADLDNFYKENILSYGKEHLDKLLKIYSHPEKPNRGLNVKTNIQPDRKIQKAYNYRTDVSTEEKDRPLSNVSDLYKVKNAVNYLLLENGVDDFITEKDVKNYGVPELKQRGYKLLEKFGINDPGQIYGKDNIDDLNVKFLNFERFGRSMNEYKAHLAKDQVNDIDPDDDNRLDYIPYDDDPLHKQQRQRRKLEMSKYYHRVGAFEDELGVIRDYTNKLTPINLNKLTDDINYVDRYGNISSTNRTYLGKSVSNQFNPRNHHWKDSEIAASKANYAKLIRDLVGQKRHIFWDVIIYDGAKIN